MENINAAQQPPELAIYKIIYHSDITIDGGHDQVLCNIKSILEWSRMWNPKHGITGALMLNDKKFSQVLEGPAGTVRSLFGHIVCDRRHKTVELLQADYFRERDFASWSMAFAGSAWEPDIKLASTVPTRDVALSHNASGVINLLRWLLSEDRLTKPIR